MDEVQIILNDIENKYGEWLEMAGDNSAILKERLIVQMLLKEITRREHCERELRKMRHRAGNTGMA